MQVTPDILDAILGFSLILLGLIQVFFPHAAIRLRNRFGNIRRFDGTDWIYGSKHGSLFVRLCGLAFIFFGAFILTHE